MLGQYAGAGLGTEDDGCLTGGGWAAAGRCGRPVRAGSRRGLASPPTASTRAARPLTNLATLAGAVTARVVLVIFTCIGGLDDANEY